MVALEDVAAQAYKGKHSKDKPKALGKNDEDADVLFKQLKGKPIQGSLLLVLVFNFISFQLYYVKDVIINLSLQLSLSK